MAFGKYDEGKETIKISNQWFQSTSTHGLAGLIWKYLLVEIKFQSDWKLLFFHVVTFYVSENFLGILNLLEKSAQMNVRTVAYRNAIES